MTDNDRELLEAIERNTRAIAQLLSRSVASKVLDRIKTILDTDQKLNTYALSDGDRSARELA